MFSKTIKTFYIKMISGVFYLYGKRALGLAQNTELSSLCDDR